MLSQGNTVAETIYEAKQIFFSLGLEVKKIHTCKNSCILYRGTEYKDLEKCIICRLGRFNRRKDFPIIPHLKRWFANKKVSELL
jgi:hypothetical protein